MVNNGREYANVKIKWFFWREKDAKLLELPPEELVTRPFAELYLGYYAMRQIAAGEELLLDYGAAWLMAWHEYETRMIEHKLMSKEAQTPEVLFRAPIEIMDELFPNNWRNAGRN